MEKETPINTEESLVLIQKMIKTVQSDIEDDSFYFLLWGWSVFAACMVQFILMSMESPNNAIGWVILMPLAGIVTWVYAKKQDKEKRVKTYIDELMGYVLIAFLASLFITLFFQAKLQLNTYPIVMLIYGVWLFVSGGALKFKPLIYGGVINWIFAIGSFFLMFKMQLVALAGAVLLGYIIPGHMLKMRHNKQVSQNNQLS